MLRLQRLVYDNTVDIDARAKLAKLKALDRALAQRAIEQGNQEEDIVKMCSAAVRLIEDEGSAITFAKVTDQIRDDMIKVANRLKKNTDVGQFTQTIEKDIIESLEDMIKALKKARKDNKKKNKPKPSKPNGGKPGDEDLIDLLAELKMIRAMQAKINKRTADYHKFYPDLEQAPDPKAIKDEAKRKDLETVHDELQSLHNRQEDLERSLKDLANGKNKTKD